MLQKGEKTTTPQCKHTFEKHQTRVCALLFVYTLAVDALFATDRDEEYGGQVEGGEGTSSFFVSEPYGLPPNIFSCEVCEILASERSLTLLKRISHGAGD